LFHLDEWEIDNFRMRSALVKEPSTYGDPSLTTGSEYSYIQAEITISRSRCWLLYFKTLTTVFISFLVASSCFLIKVDQSGTRFSLCTGALFAAIASSYILESRIPGNTVLTLIESIHHFTFVMILLSIIISAIFLKISQHKSERYKRHLNKADHIVYIGYLLTYAIVLSIMTIKAYYSE